MNRYPIDTAVAKVGNASTLARSLGISHTAVRKWLLLGRPPAERVLDIERITGVSRYQLRPDVFGPAPDTTDEAA